MGVWVQLIQLSGRWGYVIQLTESEEQQKVWKGTPKESSGNSLPVLLLPF